MGLRQRAAPTPGARSRVLPRSLPGHERSVPRLHGGWWLRKSSALARARLGVPGGGAAGASALLEALGERLGAATVRDVGAAPARRGGVSRLLVRGGCVCALGGP